MVVNEYAAWRAECCKADIEKDSAAHRRKNAGRRKTVTPEQKKEADRIRHKRWREKRAALLLAQEKRQTKTTK